jgi:hypothetical protein
MSTNSNVKPAANMSSNSKPTAGTSTTGNMAANKR